MTWKHAGDSPDALARSLITLIFNLACSALFPALCVRYRYNDTGKERHRSSTRSHKPECRRRALHPKP